MCDNLLVFCILDMPLPSRFAGSYSKYWCKEFVLFLLFKCLGLELAGRMWKVKVSLFVTVILLLISSFSRSVEPSERGLWLAW
jgi:hypothetical protein